ncbi:C99L2 protein, partial [Anseranas semipalmata]|nr:C99L2 protein [Anseranas semipalmata]
FDDSDLYDGSLPRGGGGGGGSDNTSLTSLSILKECLQNFFSASQGAVAGIVSAVVATVIGAVSSFIAYQKKKLCFKQSGKNS